MISSKDGEKTRQGRTVKEPQTIIDAASSRKTRLRKSEYKGAPLEIEFLSDVSLRISVVLAETKMPVRELLALGTDSVVQLNKLSGDPVDIYVENQKLGKGEVIVLQEKLRIRLLEITPPAFNYNSSETEG